MGCPLAALCFVYALHQAIHATNNTMTQMDTKATILAYMDDMYIMVHLEHLKHNLTKIGLHLNEDKTTVWHPDHLTREQLKQHGYPITTALRCSRQPHSPSQLPLHRRRPKEA